MFLCRRCKCKNSVDISPNHLSTKHVVLHASNRNLAVDKTTSPVLKSNTSMSSSFPTIRITPDSAGTDNQSDQQQATAASTTLGSNLILPPSINVRPPSAAALESAPTNLPAATDFKIPQSSNASNLSPTAVNMMKLVGNPDSLKVTNKLPASREKVVIKPGHSMVHWMNLIDNKQPNSASAISIDFSGIGKPDRKRTITLDELAKHDKTEDAWLAIHGNVYSVTKFLEYHPGGSEVLDEWLGKNGTEMFMFYHAFVNYERLLKPCQVGVLAPAAASTTSSSASSS